MRKFLLLLIFCISCDYHYTQTTEKHIAKDICIAFGSCNKEYKEQPLWDTILKNNPDLWIWLGDVIYADTEDMNVMAEKYKQQFHHQKYTLFRQKLPIIGIWDDHDYGVNNGGEEYSMKKESQQLFLDFLEEPADSIRRKQEGVYASYTYGEAQQKVKVILLDTRFHRQMPGKENDILGEKQWSWLEGELKNSDAQIHIICSSIQIISKDHPYEKWNNFPMARKRLFDLLVEAKVPGVFIFSGDRHFSEISKLAEESLPYPIHEVTSSGLTHTASIPINILRQENSQYRVTDCFSELHFGLFIVDWENENVSLQIVDKNNSARLKYIVPFSSWKILEK